MTPQDGVVGLSFGSGEPAGSLCVIAATAFNGLALTAYETWAFRRADMGAFVESPFRCENGEKATMARIQTLPGTLWGAARIAAFGEPLLAPLAGSLDLLPAKSRVGLGLALPTRLGRAGGAVGRDQRAAIVKAFETRLAARSWTLTTHTEERGHAGFAHVLLAMATALERREIDAAIVGGLDSYYDPEAMQELIDARRLFDGEQLDSMIPGEGGALLLIARRDTVHQLRGKPVAEIRAVAVGVEPALPDNEIPSTAVGLTGAVLACGSWLKRRNKPLGWWLSDMTGEEFRVQELQLVWPRVSGDLDLRGVHLDFLGSHLGDLGAATLPTALAIAIEGLNRGAPAAQHALCTASSVTSERGCVLLEAVGSGGA